MPTSDSTLSEWEQRVAGARRKISMLDIGVVDRYTKPCAQRLRNDVRRCYRGCDRGPRDPARYRDGNGATSDGVYDFVIAI
jgi:hypothetical protein